MLSFFCNLFKDFTNYHKKKRYKKLFKYVSFDTNHRSYNKAKLILTSIYA
jgi:hypothetical protein